MIKLVYSFLLNTSLGCIIRGTHRNVKDRAGVSLENFLKEISCNRYSMGLAKKFL
jgi:hypothetical protein